MTDMWIVWVDGMWQDVVGAKGHNARQLDIVITRFLSWKKDKNPTFTTAIPTGKTIQLPIAHGEGRLLFPKEKEDAILERLIDEDMIVLRYCNNNGEVAEGKYPANPNGSFYDIAGICNKEGNIFGLMPHPERAMYWWQLPNWTSTNQKFQYGDGKLIFQSIINTLTKKSSR